MAICTERKEFKGKTGGKWYCGKYRDWVGLRCRWLRWHIWYRRVLSNNLPKKTKEVVKAGNMSEQKNGARNIRRMFTNPTKTKQKPGVYTVREGHSLLQMCSHENSSSYTHFKYTCRFSIWLDLYSWTWQG